jgi:hypothetical protein
VDFLVAVRFFAEAILVEESFPLPKEEESEHRMKSTNEIVIESFQLEYTTSEENLDRKVNSHNHTRVWRTAASNRKKLSQYKSILRCRYLSRAFSLRNKSAMELRPAWRRPWCPRSWRGGPARRGGPSGRRSASRGNQESSSCSRAPGERPRWRGARRCR